MDKVIFRKYSDGEIVALFPEISASLNGYLCESYSHFGQHGAADPFVVIRQTKLATAQEYADLLEELEQIGYNPKAVKRQGKKAREIRRKQYNT